MNQDVRREYQQVAAEAVKVLLLILPTPSDFGTYRNVGVMNKIYIIISPILVYLKCDV
jgi:hypothetical protein